MKIDLKEIAIRDLFKDYVNNSEDGVTGFGGKLNIRPKYQREFVYKDIQRDAVIDTVRKNFPLNTMYWVKSANSSVEDLEVLDGQQRTISICEYIQGKFAINFQYFHNLEDDEKDQILDYKLMVYFCEGGNREKLDWFKTINIAGEKLTEQELRNAVFTGAWLNDAKKYFSKTNCAAYILAKDYVVGSPIRQQFLETALDWISDGNIQKYMADNQKKPNASEIWLYFNRVIEWVKVTFPHYRKEMKGVNFGSLYNKFKDDFFDADELEKELSKLMQDEDVTKKSGIYTYILTREERYLSVRVFTDNQKTEAFERQKGVCVKCNNTFKFEDMAGDHIVPWSKGGKTISSNCQMLCKKDNGTKSND